MGEATGAKLPEPITLAQLHRRLDDYYGPQAWWPAQHPFEVILGAILTQNTAWINVEKALSQLRQQQGLSLARMRQTSIAELEAAIRPAGFYRRKSRCIKAIAAWLGAGGIAAKRRQQAAPLRASLLEIPGIGPETADAILLYALDKPIFVIDNYTRRILSRLGFAVEFSSYLQLQQKFVATMAPDLPRYQQYHALLVAHAKTHCRKQPICASCPLSQQCLYYLARQKPS